MAPRNILLTVLRADLRLADNLLFHLAQEPTPPSSAFQKQSHRFRKEVTHLLPIYIYDQRQIEVGGLPGLEKGGKQEEARTRTAGLWRCGEHRTSFLTHSIFDLRSRLQARNSDLSIWAGVPNKIIPAIIKALRENGDEVEAVWMTKEIMTEEINEEERIRKALQSSQTPYHLLDQRSLVNHEDLPFPIEELPDVYTEFRKQVEGEGWREPLPTPERLKPYPKLPKIPDAPSVYSFQDKEQLKEASSTISALLKPLHADPSPMNHTNLKSRELENVPSAIPFKGGETEAQERLKHYFEGRSEKGASSPASTYKETRNGMLGVDYSTKFSIFLAHGLLSPREIAKRAEKMDKDNGKSGRNGGGYWIIFELLWADYFLFVSMKYGSSLFTLRGIEALDNPEKRHNWVSPKSLEDENDTFVRWCKGTTGVPFIDAPQRELIQTGYMSNRARQNVASFLVKDLGYDWRLGAEFFESFLIDSQSTWSNWGNWQYVAGVGNDPRTSRQFNAIKQAKDYDPQGKYITTWIPALKSMEGRNEVSHPWTCKEGVPEGYPSRPVIEQGTWRTHYSPRKGGAGGRSNNGPRAKGNGRGRGRGPKHPDA